MKMMREVVAWLGATIRVISDSIESKCCKVQTPQMRVSYIEMPYFTILPAREV